MSSAKTKVAPIKTISLPRLELSGALLLSQMLSNVLAEISIPTHELFCWTDSTVVLSWLQKPPCAWKTFVASRVAKIQEAIGISCWHHVSGTEIPADVGSQGTTSSKFITDSLWWHGQAWLLDDRSKWPGQEFMVPSTNEEAKPVKIHLATEHPSIEELLRRFSCYARALSVLTCVLRFVNALKRNSRATTTNLTNTEMRTTQMVLIKLIQKEHYPIEYHHLETKKPLPSKSCLLSLNPMMDEQGVLIHSTSLSMNERYPIILPRQSHYSRELIRVIHAITLRENSINESSGNFQPRTSK